MSARLRRWRHRSSLRCWLAHSSPQARIVRIVAAALTVATAGAAPALAQDSLQWHGYTQLRYGRSDPATGFVIRRGKLWVTGPAPGVAGLSFGAQAVFRNAAGGAFVLQDLFADYHGSHMKLRVGQFVPAFSLQRSQPDYLIPLVERAAVVETLVPGARTMGRDVGAQVSLAPASGVLNLALGLFDGSGANRVVGKAGDYLATGRVILATEVASGARALLGGSVALRETSAMDVGALAVNGAEFAGTDFRWGGDARLAGDGWELQGEYLQANLDGEVSRGFYALGDLAVTQRDAVALSVEHLNTPGGDSEPAPWCVAGLTHLLGAGVREMVGGEPHKAQPGDKLPTKLMADFRVRLSGARPRTGAAVQFQVLFH